ncbi:FAD-dependent oxidoreductase [[Kitasatospora] papulosa]|uniref:FAD-dependent oxidoreductase n=1 Tax=[Kitasatospora] papulosa TaxID=1464011 RepID=UPI0036AD704D
MAPRTAEIAGAGLAGLTLATRLAQLGWHVRLHERNDELRMYGAGIWLWESGLQTLETLGAFDQATKRARTIREWRIADHGGKPLMSRYTGPGDRMLLPPRADLYAALIARAEYYGVDIVTSSLVTGMSADGRIEYANGKTSRADLVVAADGAYSRLRESIFCTAWMDFGSQAGIRMLIDRSDDQPDDTIIEYWHGARRLLFNPCTDEQDYIFLSAPVGDDRAGRLPVDRDLWAVDFPAVADLVHRFAEDGRWDRLVNVRCRRWSAGHAAVLGDAAHAMPPNLGQAANTAFINAMALAALAEQNKDITTVLPEWERRQKAITDHVQRWSYYYGFVLGHCPSPLLGTRARTLGRLSQTQWFDRNLNRGARHQPMGSLAVH